jgi:hypothetical protein
MRNESRPRLLRAALLFVSSGFLTVQAAKLDPSGWSLVNPALTDNSLSTFATSTQVSIDFGTTNTIDRVYLTGTNRSLQYWPNDQTASSPPLGRINILVGSSWPPTNLVSSWDVPYDAGIPIDTEIDSRFRPVSCRYVQMLLVTNFTWVPQPWESTNVTVSSNLTWRVAELEIYGVNGLCTNRDCVVESTNSTSNVGPLNLAASDLSYYLTELEGYPVPIVSASQTNAYPGTIYNVVDLKPLAPDYNTMMANVANGSLPTNVTVYASGRDVIFSGWPYRDVLWGVWQFLNNQGVRWVYPSGDGEYVPRGNGVSFSMLPVNYTPSATCIFANFDSSTFEPWAPGTSQTLRQSDLYLWRNFWNGSWTSGPLGGSEIPALPTVGTLNTNYTEGFSGFPHNFNNVVPTRILNLHQEWWGWTNTSSSSATESQNNPMYQLDYPSLISWVASKLTNVATVQPLASVSPLNINDRYDAINLLPLDSSTWSQDPYTLASNLPIQLNPVPGATMMTNAYSGAYYSFVNAVASQASQWGYTGLVGALAYSDVFPVPNGIPTFPTNVWVEVCLYGAPNLPMTASGNSAMKAALISWKSTCSNLATYDYALLHTDPTFQTNPMQPVPLVCGIVGTAQYLSSAGMLNGECQGSIPSIQYNPWNFYAWPQIRWNTNQTYQTIESNFFNYYYRESAAPMLAYYQAMENYQNAYNVNLHLYWAACYGLNLGSYPLSVLYPMQTNLTLAQSEATNWTTISRVADQTNAFVWLLGQWGLTGVNLTNLSLYPTVPTTIYTVNLTNMVKFTNSPAAGCYAYWQSGGYWNFGAQAIIKQTLNFPQAGTYNVTVSADAIPSAGIYPVLTAFIGPTNSSQTITASSYTNYSYVLSVPYPGAWDLALQYQNAATGGARQININGIQITKVGDSSEIQANPTNITFGAILSGTSLTSSFTVQNVGGGTLSGTASVNAPFNIVSGGSYSLGSDQSQTVTVSFNPTTAGNYSQNVTLTGGGGATVAVSGNATNAPVPAAIQVNPGSVAFGTILSGTSQANSFTVANVGGGTLNGAASVGAPFSILSGGSYSLDSNQSQTVTVLFNPTTAGNYSQSVTLTGGGGATVAVSGSATNAPVSAAIQVNPGSVAFGTILNGTSKTNSFTVANVGGGTLNGVASVGAPFSILSGGSYSLSSNASQVVTVVFSPTVASNYNQSVTFTGGGGTNTTVTGSATNAPVNPVIHVTPGSIAYGTLLSGTSATNSFTVQNVGGGTLSGTASVGAPFSILSGGSYNLGSNQSQTVKVVFSPTVASNYSQSVTFTGGGGTNSTVTGSATNAPPVLPVVSAISVNATAVDTNAPGLQIYPGTIVQLSATATNALTWQWSYTVNGGSPVVYTNSTSPVTNISFCFDTNAVGNSYIWTLVVSNGQAWAESQTNFGVEDITQGPAFTATSGTWSGFLTAQSVIDGILSTYIYQSLPSIGSTSGGTAVYNFTITNAGNYEVQALVNAPSLSANSFFVNIDGQPQNPTMIWDIIPVTPGFQQRMVSWRGNGSENNDQIVPKIFNLGVGPHEIIFVGRSPGTALAGLTLLQLVPLAQPQSPPVTPNGLRIISSSP